MKSSNNTRVGTIQKLLKRSYTGSEKDLNGYAIDKDLSGKRVQVYKDKTGDDAFVVHRGTQSPKDLATDLYYAFGGDLKNTDRYKQAEKIQKEAEMKYGAKNITTVGHSLGSMLGSAVGKDSKQIISYNKGVSPFDAFKKQPKNEINIKTALDPVSALLRKDDKTIVIPSRTLDPFKEHGLDALSRLNPRKTIGGF